MCRGIFNEKPIICKLGDLGEGRSQATQTKTMVSNVTKMVNRGSPAFMAPEISLDQYMLETASIEQLKAIDNWALLMTIFIVMNPDQEYPFELDVKEQQNTKKQTSQLNLLRQHLKKNCSLHLVHLIYLCKQFTCRKLGKCFIKRLVSSQTKEKQCIV